MFKLWATNPNNAYELIETSETFHIVHSNAENRISTGHPSKLVVWSAFICLFCTIINLLIILLLFASNSPPFTLIPPRTLGLTLGEAEMQALRRPSQFIGLDQVNRSSPSTPKSFANYPILMTQVDRTNPESILGADSLPLQSTAVGMIFPSKKRLRVSDSLSTIVQFRAIDFGMEMCELQITSPNQTDVSSGIHSPKLIPSTVELFRLETSVILNEKRLSYRTRPSHGRKVADIDFKYGMKWVQTFSCAMEEVVSFELACARTSRDGPKCQVDWWQDIESTLSSILLIQYSTV